MNYLLPPTPMLRTLLLLVLAIFLVSCDRQSTQSSNNANASTSKLFSTHSKPVQRTIMLYMIGSDLESEGNEGSSNLQAMVRAKQSPFVNFAIQTGGANTVGWDTVRRLTVSANALQEQADLGELNMGTTDALTDFIRWSAKTFPAEEYVLVFWSHGSGSVNLGGQDYGLVGPDEVFTDSLTAREIELALKSVKEKDAISPAMVGFDACLMGSVEVANLLRPYANYLLASQELEPGNGWDYQAWIDALASKPEMTVGSLGKIIIDTYFEQYKGRADVDALTLSLTDLVKLEKLIASADQWAKAVMPNLQRSEFLVWEFARARSETENYGRSGRFDAGMIDLKDFVQNVERRYSQEAKDKAPEISTEDAKTIQSNTRQRIKDLAETVAYTRSSESRNWASGLSSFIPSSFQLLNRDFNRIVKDQIRPLVMSADWKAMLDTYRTALAKAPIPLEIHSVTLTNAPALNAKLDGDSELVDGFFVAILAVDSKSITILGNVLIDEETALNGSDLSFPLEQAQLISLEGMTIFHHEIDAGDDFSLLSIPANVNSAESEIVVRRNILGATESFRVIGYRAAGEENAQKRLTAFKAGDAIEPLYPRITKSDSADQQEVSYVPIHPPKKLAKASPKVSLQAITKRRGQQLGIYFFDPSGNFELSKNTIFY